MFDEAVGGLPAAVRAGLGGLLETGGPLPGPEVVKTCDSSGLDVGALMVRLLPVAAAFARVPISDFHVGAVALGARGSLYLGTNLEFEGQALSLGVHGEQCATNGAWLHGETGLQALAINAAPCGYCRQFLFELDTATKGFEILLQGDPAYTRHPLEHFLPDPFGPAQLGQKGGLMRREQHPLELASPPPDPAVEAALEAARESYAPYTRGFAGAALQLEDGTVVAGRYAENAAYNPSLSPLAAALAFAAVSGPPDQKRRIVDAVLVEESSLTGQRGACEAVLASVAPGVALRFYPAFARRSS